MPARQHTDSRQMPLDWSSEPGQPLAQVHAQTQAMPTAPQASPAASTHLQHLQPMQPWPDAACAPLLQAAAVPFVHAPAIITVSAMQHPQANRQIVLEQHALGYLLQRRRRRSVGMRVGPQGLLVAAPPWVAVAEIEQILRGKARWIVRKLHEQVQHNHAARQLGQAVWQNGICLPWQGGLLHIKLTQPAQANQGKALRAAYVQQQIDAAQLLDANSGQAQSVLQLDLPENMAADALRQTVCRWMQQQAIALFAARLAHYAPQLGVRPSSLKLSNAASRWGSATSQGGIRLHWRLVQMPPQLLDYVVVHELAHLHEMNHSPRFWGLVEKILPDYRQRQYQLTQTRLPPW